MHTRNRSLVLPRVGILGAGRLGRALARRVCVLQDRRAPVWSRRFDNGDASPISSESDFSIAALESVMQADAVFAAIPSRGIADLARTHRAVREYAGTLFITGIDLSVEAVERLIPAALVVRVVPALLPGRDDVPCLVLDSGNRETRWRTCAQVVLEALGPVHCVDDEKTFESVMHLVSPFPVVLRRALRDAIAAALTERDISAKWQPVAERVLWQALAAMQTTPAPDRPDTAEADVATPGGVTAAGLDEAGRLARVMADTLSVMMRRAQQLRDDDDKGRQEQKTEHLVS